MRLYSSFNFYASIYGIALAAVSNLHDVAARIVGPSDIRENIKESKSFAKMNEGEECIKLEANISKNEKNTENVGAVGCGEDLICLEDASSSTGARCVDFLKSLKVDEEEAGSCITVASGYYCAWGRQNVGGQCCDPEKNWCIDCEVIDQNEGNTWDNYKCKCMERPE